MKVRRKSQHDRPTTGNTAHDRPTSHPVSLSKMVPGLRRDPSPRTALRAQARPPCCTRLMCLRTESREICCGLCGNMCWGIENDVQLSDRAPDGHEHFARCLMCSRVVGVAGYACRKASRTPPSDCVWRPHPTAKFGGRRPNFHPWSLWWRGEGTCRGLDLGRCRSREAGRQLSISQHRISECCREDHPSQAQGRKCWPRLDRSAEAAPSADYSEEWNALGALVPEGLVTARQGIC